jgi:hypothetical protein
VSEHGGLLLARNRREGAGAVFEIVLPCRRDDAPRGIQTGRTPEESGV